jgi:hypothetical protein
MWQESYLYDFDHLSAHCTPNDTPHLPLVVLLAMSVGDLAMIPLSSSRSTAAPEGTLVPWESAQEVLMLQV